MSSSYSSLDWVLSKWVHITVHSLNLVVFICVYFVFFFHTAYMLCHRRHSGVDLVGLKPLELIFLQCFVAVGWVF